MLTDAIDETREQIARLMDLEEAHELCLAGFRHPGGHGLLDKFEWEEDDEKI